MSAASGGPAPPATIVGCFYEGLWTEKFDALDAFLKAEDVAATPSKKKDVITDRIKLTSVLVDKPGQALNSYRSFRFYQKTGISGR